MTCIVGLVDNGKVHLGGDSAGVDSGYNRMQIADPKVFVNGDFVMGYTTSFRMGQLLRYKFKAPHREEGRDPMAYMVSEWVDAVRACLKDSGYAQKDKEQESAGTFLVGYAGRLFRIEDEYCVLEVTDGYDACGCGQGFARGAMHATPDLPPRQRMQAGLKAAAHHSAGVAAPFHFVSV